MARRWIGLLLSGLMGCGTAEPALDSPAPRTAASAHRETPQPAKPSRPETPRDASTSQHTVRADDGHPLRVWSREPEQPSATIVLVHGRTWSGQPDFDLQVPGETASTLELLAEQGVAAYAVDLRGYGQTPRDATGWLTPTRAADDLAAVLDWVATRSPDGEPPALLGWSLGSMSAQLVTQQHPDKVDALILYGYPRTPGHRHAKGPDATVSPPRGKTTRAGALADFVVGDNISRAAKQAFADQAVAADPVRVDWRAMDEFDALDAAKVRVPTLIIHGAADPYAPASAQAKLFAGLGHDDRAWVMVAGADHAAHLENTRHRFVHAVVAFIRRPDVRP